MKILNKAVLPKGFKAGGKACGIKKSGKPDLALFFSLQPAVAAGMFTSNAVPAAPVIVCRKHLRSKGYFQAVIANSGNANCFTGKAGLRDAELMAEYTADCLGIKKESVLVASTGIIGRRLALDKIRKGLPELAANLSDSGIGLAKKAIMTTDTFAKEITVKFAVGGKEVTISGVAKGAGMISPKMATMLCFIFTDAAIARKALESALKIAVADSFNCITVDGCMSTNDMVSVLANGAAGNPAITAGKNLKIFSAALKEVCLALAKMMVRDGEGATKFITIKVNKAASTADARRIALAVANYALFKTAIFAQSRNFYGRTVAACGASGARIDPARLKVWASPLEKKDITVTIDVNLGNSAATVYTSDLTYEYIKINAEYN